MGDRGMLLLSLLCCCDITNLVSFCYILGGRGRGFGDRGRGRGDFTGRGGGFGGDRGMTLWNFLVEYH